MVTPHTSASASPSQTATTLRTRQGYMAGITAYVLWGFFPIYFILLTAVGAVEILMHRIVWAAPFGALIIIFRHQSHAVISALKNPRIMAFLTLAAIAIAINWGLYVWAIHQEEIFQASLGYYINPLFYMIIGVLFFKERLSPLQLLAAILAAIGVAVLTFQGGSFPWISIVLAISFTIYGVIRKQVKIGAMPGLFIEILILFLPALTYLIYLNMQGVAHFAAGNMTINMLLIFLGPLTIIPLLCFAIAARRLPLSTIGFLQFISPTLQFFCGLYFENEFTTAHMICFSFIWLAVIIFSWETVRAKPPQVQNAKS